MQTRVQPRIKYPRETTQKIKRKKSFSWTSYTNKKKKESMKLQKRIRVEEQSEKCANCAYLLDGTEVTFDMTTGLCTFLCINCNTIIEHIEKKIEYPIFGIYALPYTGI